MSARSTFQSSSERRSGFQGGRFQALAISWARSGAVRYRGPRAAGAGSERAAQRAGPRRPRGACPSARVRAAVFVGVAAGPEFRAGAVGNALNELYLVIAFGSCVSLQRARESLYFYILVFLVPWLWPEVHFCTCL